MGRSKLPLKKIENPISRQVTFSKRKVGLIKKAYELSTLCDIDIALIMFSPSGRLACFSSKWRRIEDVFACYLSLPKHERKAKIKNPQFLYKMLKKARKETDMSSSNNPEETKQIEDLHREISRTQQEIKAKTNILRLFEQGSTKTSSLKETENYEKLILDLIARYDERLMQLEGQDNATLSAGNQSRNWNASSEALLKEDNVMLHGGRKSTNRMHQPSLGPDISNLQTAQPVMQQGRDPQPLLQQYFMQRIPCPYTNTMQQSCRLSTSCHHNFLQQFVFDASSSSEPAVAPVPLVDASVWISMQQTCNNTQGQQPLMQHPIQCAASDYAVESSYTMEQLKEHCLPMQKPESEADRGESFPDLEGLLAGWNEEDKPNELMSAIGADQDGMKEMPIGDFYLYEEFISIPPNTNVHVMQAANEDLNQMPDDFNFIVDP